MRPTPLYPSAEKRRGFPLCGLLIFWRACSFAAPVPGRFLLCSLPSCLVSTLLSAGPLTLRLTFPMHGGQALSSKHTFPPLTKFLIPRPPTYILLLRFFVSVSEGTIRLRLPGPDESLYFSSYAR